MKSQLEEMFTFDHLKRVIESSYTRYEVLNKPGFSEGGYKQIRTFADTHNIKNKVDSK